MIDEIPFGEWLRKQRRSLDLTRQALAKQAGCAEITLRRIENGTLKPSKELVQILLEKLGIPELEHPQWILFARGLSSFPTQPIDTFVSQLLTNLPASLTTFIGREKEQVEIIKLIRKYRLVTLTGPGGVGKTRLSIKVGEQGLGDYVNGVWLVELASLTDPALLPQAVITLFGIAAPPNTSPTEILINFLRTKTILLILDNCEHLLEACAKLADMLLKNCPNLKILATSRETLGITGEAAYPVPSLGLPNLEQLLEKFREYESVRLFEERAQLAKTDFSLTVENASSIAQICIRLDGIPLAIELAAAHVNMFSTEQIAVRLNENFNLLTGGSRTALPRQQTIHASIAWSWNLLSDSERILLRRLSVFAGGWILESAEAVCCENKIEKKQMVDLMSHLAVKSLVVTNQESGYKRRFHLHETIRQYAHERLVEADETENIRSQHLKYFLGLSTLAEPEFHGFQQMEWYSRINDERDNIRGALEQASRTDLEAGLYLVGGLIRYWRNFDLREGLLWATEFVQRPESKNYPHGRAKALYTQGNILLFSQEFNAVRSTVEECLTLFRACDDRQGEIDSLMLMGDAMQYLKGMDEKAELSRQALALALSIGDKWMQARALSALGWDQRDPRQARDQWEEAVTLFRQVGDLRELAHVLAILGFKVLSNGDVESAQKFLDEALGANRITKDKRAMEFVLTGKSQIALMRGEYEQARAFLQENMDIHQEIGNRMGFLWGRARLGYVVLREGKVTEAQHIFVETIENFQLDRNKNGLAFVLEKMASLYVVKDIPEVAVRLIGWSDATRKETGDPRPRLEQIDLDSDITVMRAKIGDAAFKDAYNKGRAMTLDEAVAYALKED